MNKKAWALAPWLFAAACGGITSPSTAANDASPGATKPPLGDGSAATDGGGPPIDGASEEASPSSDAGRAPPPDPTTASSFLINTAHTSAIQNPTLEPPLSRRWSVPLAPSSNYEYISYPLIVHGSVVVLVTAPSQSTTNLIALDAQTGAVLWGPVDAKGAFAHAYDGGRLFVVNEGGLLQAFDASSGAHLWSEQLPNQYAFSAAPTAYRGIVYVGGSGTGGTIYAVDETNGAIVWTSPVIVADDSAPTLGEEGLFVSYSCVQAYAFDRLSGAQRWHHSGACGGGGGATTVLFEAALYALDGQGNLELDANTGAPLGAFSADTSPAFDGQTGFFLTRAGLSAADVKTRTVAWSFAGDGTLDTSPVVVGGQVYVGSLQGMLYAVDESTGVVTWSENTGARIASQEISVGFPLSTMAAAEGVLVVPEGPALVAYAHASADDAGMDGE